MKRASKLNEFHDITSKTAKRIKKIVGLLFLLPMLGASVPSLVVDGDDVPGVVGVVGGFGSTILKSIVEQDMARSSSAEAFNLGKN